MANNRSIEICFLLFLTLTYTNALYEDQAGKFDWKRSYIGKINQAQFDHNNRLVVTTQENLIASINPRNGQILWRQVLEEPSSQQQQHFHIDRDAITVSGASNVYYVRGWETSTGNLLWEWTINPERPTDSLWTIKDDTLIHIALIPGQQLEITQYATKTGEIRQRSRKITGNWVGDSQKCIISHPYCVCTFNGQVFWTNIAVSSENRPKSASIQTLTGNNEAGSVQLIEFDGTNQPSFLLAFASGSTKLIQFKENGDLTLHQFELQPNAKYVSNTIFQLEVNAENPEKLIKITSKHPLSGKDERTYNIDYPKGLGAPFIVTGQCRNEICDLLLCSTDNALTYVRLPEGRVAWTREEALADVIAAEFFELPVSELDVSIENEFKSSDVLTMLTHRLNTQTKQLYSLFLGGQLLTNNGLVRDDFGLHKIIVMATSVGKLFGIDTLTGSIVWSYRLPNVKAFSKNTMMLLVQRTARYAPLPAQCVLLAQDANSGLGVMFVFDPITGVSQKGIERLSYKVKQVLLLPHEDENHLKPILIIDGKNSVKVIPESGGRKMLEKNKKNIFVYTLDGTKMQGYRLGDELNLNLAWNMNFGDEAQIVAVSTRPINEKVHSLGRVVPDRSVYYKYVNPNLVAIATMHDDVMHKHVLSVYLIDGVTGHVVHSASHKRAKGPVHLIHSENWLVYTFFNERFRRFEMVASELYDGVIQSNSTAFSSFSIDKLPDVQTQSYILPATPTSMSVTLTERGITNKFLLVGLSTGAVTEIPWMLLQPRFADLACGPEESCIPYMPEIPLPNEATINYNQTLERIKGIQVAPARLESTSHVLIYGLDLFYTRVAPSKTFDVLKEDFDHRLIILVLSGLIVASYVTKYLASKKTLRQAWK